MVGLKNFFKIVSTILCLNWPKANLADDIFSFYALSKDDLQTTFFLCFCPFNFVFASPWKSMHFFVRNFISSYLP